MQGSARMITTKGAFTKRWAIALRWWCGGKAPPARLTNRLWTCRFAWTTQERCPHAHSHNNNRMLSQLETRESSGRVQLRTGLKWSRSWGPLQFFRSLRSTPRHLNARQVILDGLTVVLRKVYSTVHSCSSRAWLRAD